MRPRIAILAAALAVPSVGWAQDSDADGIADAVDVEPCDASVASWSYSPALGAYGMVIFEDLWPTRGDFDFNDVVFTQNTTLGLDAMGRLTRIRLELDVLALGATFDNGLGYQLPIAASSVASATLRVDGGAATPMTVWTGETQATLTIAQSLRALFGGAPGFINTDPALPTVPPVHLSIEIVLAAGQAIDPSLAPFDLFLLDPSRGVEVHRPEMRGTSRLDPALIGTADDGTTASRAFVTRNGIPFALAFPQVTAFPPEGQSIELLFTNIAAFGASQGTASQDFYQYPVPGRAYPTLTISPVPAGAAPDTSCISVNPPVDGVCGPADGAALAWAPQGAALCATGAASAVASSPTGWTWSCAGANGGVNAACTSPLTTGGPSLCETQLQWVALSRLEASPDATSLSGLYDRVDGRGTATNAIVDSVTTSRLVDPPLYMDFRTLANVLQVSPRAYARVNYGICDYHAQSGRYVRASGRPVVRMHWELTGALHAPQPIRRTAFEQAVASNTMNIMSPYGPPLGTINGHVKIIAHGTAGDSFTGTGIFTNGGSLGGSPLYSYAYRQSGTFDMTPSTLSNNYVALTISGEASTLWATASSFATMTARFSVPAVSDPCDRVVVTKDGHFLSAMGDLTRGCLGPVP